VNHASKGAPRRALPLALLTLFGLAACEGSVDEPASQAEAPIAAVDSGLLASLRLSETHVVEFYEMSPGNGLVTEDYDVDRDRSALAGLVLRDGELLPTYRALAGARATPDALARFAAYDVRRKAFIPVANGEQAGAAVAQGAPPALQSAAPATNQKDRTSDFYWFAQQYCSWLSQPRGCQGADGSRYSWLPTDVVTCTNVVELCGSGFADPFRDRARKTRNMEWAIFNQASSGANVTGRYYLVNPCENDGNILPRLCTKGGLGHEFTVTPRHAVRSTSTATVGWTRQVEATGNHPIGAMVNAWD
jgi:hypothetical protein